MCPLSCTVISDKLRLFAKTLKTYLFGMFTLYTKLIGFVNRKMKKILKNFFAAKNRINKRKSAIFL